ncbi:MAG: hypothetical protein ACE5GQ_01920, partial [Nitrospinales bacterium]
MKTSTWFSLVVGGSFIIAAAWGNVAWADATAQAKEGLKHGGRGLIRLKQMIGFMEYSLKKKLEAKASEKNREQMNKAVEYAKEALSHYGMALAIAAKSLSRSKKDSKENKSGASPPAKSFFVPLPTELPGA